MMLTSSITSHVFPALRVEMSEEKDSQRTLKGVLRNHILSSIVGATFPDDPESRAALMILDVQTLAVLDSCMSTSDLVEHGIVAVQMLEKSREPMPGYPAIYYVTPTLEAMQAIVDDFDEAKGGPSYSAAYIFLNAKMTPDALSVLKRSRSLLSRIKALSEVPASFRALYGQFYTAGSPDQIRSWILKSDDDIKDIDDDEHDENDDDKLNELADDLLSLCARVGTVPCVRYQRGSSISKSLAQKISERGGKGSSKVTLLVLDRTFDPLAPLMSEVTLEAMCADTQLIQWKSGGSLTIAPEALADNDTPARSFHYKFEENSDDLWNLYRYAFLYNPQIAQSHSSSLNKLKQNSAVARYASMEDKSKATSSLMSSVIKDMQSYAHAAQSINCFKNTISNCRMKEAEFSLCKVADLQQSMATGKDREGGKYSLSNLTSELSSLKDKFAPFDLLRILLVAYLMRKNPNVLQSRQDRARIIDLPSVVEPVFESLDVLTGMATDVAWQPNNVRIEEGRRISGENSAYDGGLRFVPRIYELIKSLTSNSLDSNAFPFVDKSSSKSRAFVIYMIGGYSYNEMRAIATNTADTLVYFGGPCPLSSRDYIMQLAGVESEARWRATGLSKYGLTNLPECVGVEEAKRAMKSKDEAEGTIVAEEELDTKEKKSKKDKKDRRERK